MPRPKCCRWIRANPGADFFKPRGVPMWALERVTLTLDEFEALRLSDQAGKSHEDAARAMRVSRATFGRIVESAHRKVADALVGGKALEIKQCPWTRLVGQGQSRKTKLRRRHR